jgi:hypothetical protein
MAEGHADSKEYLENEKAIVTTHENAVGSLDYDSENATPDAFCRHGIDENQEKELMKKIDNHILPFASLLFILSLV